MEINNRTNKKTKYLFLLKQIRKEKKVHQKDLANKLGVHQTFISKYESGERKLDFIELEAICNTLGISLTQFAIRYEDSLKNN